jgi:hypothetical protein
MATPPDELRRAANLLEAARISEDQFEVDQLLSEVRSTCARVIDSIDAFRDPLAQSDKALRRAGS